jgi:two-component system, chemotaxis family, sensor kinase CheA
MVLDMTGFRDLYAGEASQYLRLLGRGLLALEAGEAGAVHEALRAAHTIKSMAAAMGFMAVSDPAHALEDRLVEVRDGRLAADGDCVDGLLELADLLEARVAESLLEASAPAATDAARPASVGRPSLAAAGGGQVRVSAGRLDAVAEMAADIAVLHGRAGAAGADEYEARQLSRLVAELQRGVQSLRMAPLAEAFERLPRAIRDAARRLDVEVDLVVEGGSIEIDRPILQAMVDPLLHLVRNAVAHGIEPVVERAALGKPDRGLIQVRAEQERSSVLLTVTDDGRGVGRDEVLASGAGAEADLLRVLSQPGFSTASIVTEVSGRGVGLDVVVSRVRSLGGAIEMRTAVGTGTTFSIRLPLTLSTAQVLRVRVGAEEYAIPLTHVVEAVELVSAGPGLDPMLETLRLRDRQLPIVRLRSVLQMAATGSETAAVVAEFGDRCAALAVDEIVGTDQIVMRPFAATLDTVPVFSSVTMRPDGRPSLVLDPLSVIRGA